MSYISTDVQSKQENRMLAKYFHLFEDGVLNCDYGQQFEQWFNDRFFGRSFLIKKYNKLRNMIVQRGNENVLLGKDGWAFFIQNGGLENFKNISSFSETEMAATAAYLKTVDEWCKARGKEFYFIICPDKHRVYGEYMVGVSKVKPDNESRTIKLIEYLKEHTKVKVVYLQDTLLAAKDQAILYLKNDTHWTSLGAYYGYKRIMAELNKTNRFTVVPYDEITFIKNPKGDLNAFYPEMATDDTTEYPNAVVKSEAVCRDRKDGNVLDIVCVNPQGHQSLVVFRDSFTSALKPFLDKTFSKIEYIWRYDIRHKDFDTMNKADIIIIEVLERLLPSMTKIEFPKQ